MLVLVFLDGLDTIRLRMDLMNDAFFLCSTEAFVVNDGLDLGRTCLNLVTSPFTIEESEVWVVGTQLWLCSFEKWLAQVPPFKAY